MHWQNPGDVTLVGHDIRRYPNELDRVPNRGAANKLPVQLSSTYSKVAAAVDGLHTDLKPVDSASSNSKPFVLWEKGNGFGFADVIDIVNPLQHIPIVATIYRRFSGDQIGAASRVIGGALWGRLGGLVTGLANALIEWWSGKDIGDHIYAALFESSIKDPTAAAVVEEKTTPALAAAQMPPLVPPSQDRIGNSSFETYAEVLSATPTDRAAAKQMLQSEILPLPLAARSSYEKTRRWGEPDEFLGFAYRHKFH
jgi:hypothetical protein